jgi:hypothetical protein
MKLINKCLNELGSFYNKAWTPPTLIDNIHITEEDIERDLHEGRD